jgi:hypothetical protein
MRQEVLQHAALGFQLIVINLQSAIALGKLHSSTIRLAKYKAQLIWNLKLSVSLLTNYNHKLC